MSAAFDSIVSVSNEVMSSTLPALVPGMGEAILAHIRYSRSPRWRMRLSSSLVVKVNSLSSNPPECVLVQIRGDLSCAQIDLWKTRERELATLDEKSTSSGIAGPDAR